MIQNYVIDVGTSSLKCGKSTDNVPPIQIASALGRQTMQTSSRIKSSYLTTNHPNASSNNSSKDVIMKKGYYVGNDAIHMADNLEMYYPIVNGIIKDKERAELIFDQAIDAMAIEDPSNSRIILTQASETPLNHTKYLLEIFLEKYGFNGVYVATQGYLALVGSGFTTGIVLDSGAGVSHIIPYFENTLLTGNRLDVAGTHVTKHLLSLFQKRGYSMNHSADFLLCDKIKRSYCFVAQNCEKEQRLCDETTYNDHRIKSEIGVINASDELFMAPEILFTPAYIDIEKPGVGESLFDAIQSQQQDLRMQFYKAIVLSGGTTMMKGIRNRLFCELSQLSHACFGSVTAAKQLPRIVDNPNRLSSVFRGAGMLAEFVASNQQNEFWVTKETFAKQGAANCIAQFL